MSAYRTCSTLFFFLSCLAYSRISLTLHISRIRTKQSWLLLTERFYVVQPEILTNTNLLPIDPTFCSHLNFLTPVEVFPYGRFVNWLLPASIHVEAWVITVALDFCETILVAVDCVSFGVIFVYKLHCAFIHAFSCSPVVRVPVNGVLIPNLTRFGIDDVVWILWMSSHLSSKARLVLSVDYTFFGTHGEVNPWVIGLAS